MNKTIDTLPLNFRILIKLAPLPLISGIIMAIISTMLSLAPLWIIYKISQICFSTSPNIQQINNLVYITVIILILRWGLMAISHIAAHRGAFYIQHQLQLAIAKKISKVPLSFFAQYGSGNLRRIINDDIKSLEGFFAHMLPDLVSAIVTPFIAIILLFYVNWPLALLSLTPLPIAFMAQLLMLRRANKQTNEWMNIQKKIANEIGEYIKGIREIKAFNLTSHTFGKLSQSINSSVKWIKNNVKASTGSWMVFSGILTANLVIIAPVGGWMYLNQNIDLSTYILFLMTSPLVLAPLLRLTFVLGEQAQRKQTLKHISMILELSEHKQHDKHFTLPKNSDITFKDVCLDHGDKPILEKISFNAQAGTTTAIVGHSGAGKSSLLKLIPRFYDCTSGQIKIGQYDINYWPEIDLLSQISVVFQDVYLFHGTILENLLIANPNALFEDIIKATKAANIHHVIEKLPAGYNTLIGEQGNKLSGGEKQRLSIARALLKNSPILLLDEITANVDAENEILIYRALKSLCQNRTVIMITHNLHTIINADKIIVLDNGKIIDTGTHTHLLNQCPTYQKLWSDYSHTIHWQLIQENNND
ncbi:TPA: ABC transporter ATP-binding protein [Proteus mirabilis]|uniref:ABC transporter ATP-binding protein n=1 Tax=Enterobacterales TaxID=91347 RepID=UPI0006671BEB|nr:MULTISPECIES: ABC transporter ATP-binding protein [Enterobacterales]EKV6229736.1 ABC transporter ATP-binding protein [Proteus mirabilis]ELA7681000.1 ABC transporter ATP-binding protein [Proteus mirabilis]KUT34918.1 iron ABC transporter ATP-binding protein [Escherichia coli]MBG3004439.1 ABC transporter ATP-binding protein [Proteus mirabilis]MBG3083200.1 ABC transporter ATP-binding protein [Proteus mirabilis]